MTIQKTTASKKEIKKKTPGSQPIKTTASKQSSTWVKEKQNTCTTNKKQNDQETPKLKKKKQDDQEAPKLKKKGNIFLLFKNPDNKMQNGMRFFIRLLWPVYFILTIFVQTGYECMKKYILAYT